MTAGRSTSKPTQRRTAVKISASQQLAEIIAKISTAEEEGDFAKVMALHEERTRKEVEAGVEAGQARKKARDEEAAAKAKAREFKLAAIADVEAAFKKAPALVGELQAFAPQVRRTVLALTAVLNEGNEALSRLGGNIDVNAIVAFDVMDPVRLLLEFHGVGRGGVLLPRDGEEPRNLDVAIAAKLAEIIAPIRRRIQSEDLVP